MRLFCILTLAAFLFPRGVQAVEMDSCLTVYVFVALADNEHQGIIPVSPKLGNGDDPDNNLYWGAAYGVRTFFGRSKNWTTVSAEKEVKPDTVLERCVFKHIRLPLNVIAYAYKGERIKEAVIDFLDCVAGRAGPDSNLIQDSEEKGTDGCPSPALVAYVGHDGLMDFGLPLDSLQADSTGKDAIVLACTSRQYFSQHLAALRAYPVLWTTGLMAPEAYTLEAAIVSWGEGESPDNIRTHAASAYNRYQKCGLQAAKRLLVWGP